MSGDATMAPGPIVRGGGDGFARLGGVVVGHASDDVGATGLTVVRGERHALRAAAAVVGRATGTRELLTVTTNHLVDRVDALLLTGGSAYGLDAAAGVMRWMEERGRGFAVGGGVVVPIVPAAVIFDLAPLGRADARPTPAMAYDACERASAVQILEGSVGAGAGATVGKGGGVEGAMKGGVGCAVASSPHAASGGSGDDAMLHVGALAVVNAFGDVRDASGAILAGARAKHGGFADTARLVAGAPADGGAFGDVAMRNTTLAAVIVGTPLSRAELAQVAAAATAALYRRITPVGTSFDGDVVFALSPLDAAALADADAAAAATAAAAGRGAPPHGEVAKSSADSRDRSTAPRTAPPPSAMMQSALSPAALMRVEALAVAALESAIERAVRLARGRDGIPGLADGDTRGERAPSRRREETR